MNLQLLVGNLTKDPDKVDLEGKTLCKLNVAVNENYTDKDGNRPVQYFDIVVWGQLADNCIKYLTKGSKIAVVGKSQTRVWETKEGEKRYAREVVASEIEFLSTKRSEEKAAAELPPEVQREVPDDGLPF